MDQEFVRTDLIAVKLIWRIPGAPTASTRSRRRSGSSWLASRSRPIATGNDWSGRSPRSAPALSGAVGTYAATSPRFEQAVLARLGLRAEPVSTQVVARDRHAELLQAIALASAGLELLATEIRHLVRTEVSEAREPFANGRKGSSPMPHKRNPVKSEQISGLARVLRGNTSATVENVALWHERDISHSSVERIILPDSTALIDHRQRRMLASGRGQSMLGDALASGSGPFPRLLRAEGGASAHACDRGDALAPSPTGGTTACSRQRSRGPRP